VDRHVLHQMKSGRRQVHRLTLTRRTAHQHARPEHDRETAGAPTTKHTASMTELSSQRSFTNITVLFRSQHDSAI
jgi:hypothetical protein